MSFSSLNKTPYSSDSIYSTVDKYDYKKTGMHPHYNNYKNDDQDTKWSKYIPIWFILSGTAIGFLLYQWWKMKSKIQTLEESMKIIHQDNPGISLENMNTPNYKQVNFSPTSFYNDLPSVNNEEGEEDEYEENMY